MSKKPNYDPEEIRYPEQKIITSPLVPEMEQSYIEYAMSVIVGRALPDVRDGLKPVHRRILYAMYEDNLTSDRPFKKSATCVGDVLGRYHPHGDQSVYDALVRLAQDFSMRYPLVDGHGNFGSVDGDPPAAYRYTEARMARLSDELLRDIDKDTVDWDPNFDETRKEPRVLPCRFPNLLVNGSSGIAVGMATNIPPHNLREVIGACICVLENPEAELSDLMEHVKGPDFPTKGIIMGRAGIRAAYATGRGRLVIRARHELEEFGNGRTRIVITEIPYQVNKRMLIKNMADQVEDKRLEGISDIRDETDRNGMRIVIELKKDANCQVVLNRLFAQTQLQTTFAINMLALVQNQSQPKILSLRHIIDEYLSFQEEIILRRTRYDLRKAQERAHLLEGLLIAQDNIDEVIRIIRTSYDDAKQRLCERFGLDDIQAQAILDMQLKRLQGLDREKLEGEYKELEERIAYYNKLLASDDLLRQVLKEELQAISDKFGDERCTEIQDVEDEIDIEDLIEEEQCVYTMTQAGYIKRLPASTYRSQHRGGKGIAAQSLREEDCVETVFTASTHDYILFFTNTGRVHRKKGYLIPEAGRTAKGTNIVNVLPVESGEKVTAMLHVKSMEEDAFLVLVTRGGTVKRITLESINTARKAGIRAITLDEGDELINVRITNGEQNILLMTHDGMAICFSENDVRCMGRDAVGVRGIRLREGDYVVSACRIHGEGTLLAITENGFGKRTGVGEYMRGGEEAGPQKRGGYGMKGYQVTEKTGKIAGAKVVDGDEDILLISDDGTIIRMASEDVNVYGRTAQGVRVMRLAEGAKVISLARAEKEESEETPTDENE
ncbi:DNA gyrase subunit A [Oscillibacter sp. MSJ-2]|uniref:DNA gyrase subunit A n=1 Tax=Dysosmobacter acutus TaxID=2841504 RepID=A0ABS6F6S2_9FIRM|nr:DNA gyrase subunit A [Dysosmobacter acutus]MBU5625745.1 DNA gyrase subunit A [Dysosmobacter acutus]